MTENETTRKSDATEEHVQHGLQLPRIPYRACPRARRGGCCGGAGWRRSATRSVPHEGSRCLFR
jgi:hypothetical protein